MGLGARARRRSAPLGAQNRSSSPSRRSALARRSAAAPRAKRASRPPPSRPCSRQPQAAPPGDRPRQPERPRSSTDTMNAARSSAAAALAVVAVLALWAAPCAAWGGVFNRFSPEMLSNLGYGGHGGYGGNSHRQPPFLQQENPTDIYQELAEADSEPCYGRKCTANEHCCPGSVCIDIEGVTGSCVFAYGLRQGELCRRDNDCESGLVCSEEVGEGRQCRPPSNSRKQYSEECMMSSECDIHKGLCCQFQRRHRQAPRKVCSYFKDPLICIGPVASDQVKELDIEHTAGEKRLTGHASGGPSAFNHIR